ncbi:MAG: hotdog domain-containing protein [Cyclobacteriaceae bacterium]|nr:hotdog domain-containing protein [Cyclobacteriaceae bacterium]
METRIKLSETRQFKAIFPNTLNANETLFGGQALQWMDEVAYITATRFTRQKMYTVKVTNIEFLKTVRPDSIVEVIGYVEKAEMVRLNVKVEIFMEEMYGQGRDKAMQGVFVFATLDEHHRPKKIDYSFMEN